MIRNNQAKATLSTLWIFILLNLIFRDIHEFFRFGLLEEITTGVVNGTAITEELLLVAGIILEIPLAMVVLARLLPYRVNRFANMLAAILMFLILLGNGYNDLDDVWFLGVNCLATVGIIYFSYKWKEKDVLKTREQVVSSPLI